MSEKGNRQDFEEFFSSEDIAGYEMVNDKVYVVWRYENKNVLSVFFREVIDSEEWYVRVDDIEGPYNAFDCPPNLLALVDPTENEFAIEWRRLNNPFERAKHRDKDGSEYWFAREIAPLLGYNQYRNFQPVTNKAKKACENSSESASDHFAEVRKMIQLARTATRDIKDLKLTRYACYLIVQNADPSKPVVALGQTYFAVSTRKYEKEKEFEEMTKRYQAREELKTYNKKLASTAKKAGVVNYGVFQDKGYKGLYGGLSSKDLHDRRGLKKNQKILDHMGRTELTANNFRITQTEEKLKKEKINTENRAFQVHLDVGKKVRDTIKEIGNPMPEDLPTEEDIKKVGRKIKKLEKKRQEELPD
jgi:DNA-damage-inducible protein D